MGEHKRLTKRTHLTGLQPPRDAMEMERVVALPPVRCVMSPKSKSACRTLLCTNRCTAPCRSQTRLWEHHMRPTSRFQLCSRANTHGPASCFQRAALACIHPCKSYGGPFPLLCPHSFKGERDSPSNSAFLAGRRSLVRLALNTCTAATRFGQNQTRARVLSAAQEARYAGSHSDRAAWAVTHRDP